MLEADPPSGVGRRDLVRADHLRDRTGRPVGPPDREEMEMAGRVTTASVASPVFPIVHDVGSMRLHLGRATGRCHRLHPCGAARGRGTRARTGLSDGRLDDKRHRARRAGQILDWPGHGNQGLRSRREFVATVGRVGEGPMEFGRVHPFHLDGEGHVHVNDLLRRISVIGENFELVREMRFAYPGITMAPLDDGVRHLSAAAIPQKAGFASQRFS